MTEPVTKSEIEAAKVMAEIKTVVESLISEGVDLGIIGTCVFYWFLSFYCWNREIDEVKLDKLSGNPKVQTKLAKAMQRMVKEVKDQGPTPEMKILGRENRPS
ncbi:MAG: hypothetical protein HC888_06685 [Candidatus Competibacteraceae bacterium]|nr:hypothetical protein [Candidatus Competibacteraceae bacterium]